MDSAVFSYDMNTAYSYILGVSIGTEVYSAYKRYIQECWHQIVRLRWYRTSPRDTDQVVPQVEHSERSRDEPSESEHDTHPIVYREAASEHQDTSIYDYDTPRHIEDEDEEQEHSLDIPFVADELCNNDILTEIKALCLNTDVSRTRFD